MIACHTQYKYCVSKSSRFEAIYSRGQRCRHPPARSLQKFSGVKRDVSSEVKKPSAGN